MSKSNEIKVVRIERLNPEHVHVLVKVDAKFWEECRNNNALGQLYGSEIAHEIFRASEIGVCNPIVDDSGPIKEGIKSIIFVCEDSNWVKDANVIHVDFLAKRRLQNVNKESKLA